MAKRKRILVDLDSTIVDFYTPLIKDFFKLTGEELLVENILSWDMTNHVDHKKEIVEVFHKEGFFAKLKPLPGAIEAVQKLAKDYDIEIVSFACTPWAAKEKIEWCAQWLPFINHKEIFICHRKEIIQADCLIDDAMHFAAAYKIAWPKALAIGIAWPYNADKGKVFDYRVEGYKDTAKAWRKIVALVRKNLPKGKTR